jgi:hypothetical protein
MKLKNVVKVGNVQSHEGTHDYHRQVAYDSVKDADGVTQPDLHTDSMAAHRGADSPETRLAKENLDGIGPRIKRPTLRDPNALAPPYGSVPTPGIRATHPKRPSDLPREKTVRG